MRRAGQMMYGTITTPTPIISEDVAELLLQLVEALDVWGVIWSVGSVLMLFSCCRSLFVG